MTRCSAACAPSLGSRTGCAGVAHSPVVYINIESVRSFLPREKFTRLSDHTRGHDLSKEDPRFLGHNKRLLSSKLVPLRSPFQPCTSQPATECGKDHLLPPSPVSDPKISLACLVYIRLTCGSPSLSTLQFQPYHYTDIRSHGVANLTVPSFSL